MACPEIKDGACTTIGQGCPGHWRKHRETISRLGICEPILRCLLAASVDRKKIITEKVCPSTRVQYGLSQPLETIMLLVTEIKFDKVDYNSLSHLAIPQRKHKVPDGGGPDCVDVFVLQKS